MNKTTISETLSAHLLSKTIMENLQPFFHKIDEKYLEEVEKTGEVRFENLIAADENEFYNANVFKKVINIISSFDRLEQVQIFIKRFRQSKAFLKQDITQDVWIEYHYSIHLLTIVSFMDLALILTNEVYRIGLREKDCNHDTIIKNYWVKNTRVEKALKDLEKLVQNNRNPRNTLIHHGESPKLHKVLKSDLYDKLKLMTFAQHHSEDYDSPINLDRAYSMEVRDLLRILQDECKSIETLILNLFDALLPVYIKNCIISK